jgi:hypothetical protein
MLPCVAEQLGGRKPVRLPAWLARPMVGRLGGALMVFVRGSSNGKANRELGWTLGDANLRKGFRAWLTGPSSCQVGCQSGAGWLGRRRCA